MARKVTLNCDNCGKEIEAVTAKLYLAPILPGKTITSFQSQYSHYGDLCDECTPKFQELLKRRQPRKNNSNGKVTQIDRTKNRGRTRRAS
jgi:hypothetical protein